ncbi:MAG: metallophosphoesterase family protein, partial [Bacteroidia bacterium]|nr:metallophosphoesterase family protein [Bacteroidia bacterium]
MYKVLLTITCFICINLIHAISKPELTFNDDGKFRIVQLTDIHHVVDNQDSYEVLSKLSKLLDSIKPDLVFFTGDIVLSKETQRGWDEVLTIVINRRMPWAVVFGNHDDEQGWSRAQIMRYITTKPYCLAERGPKKIQGVGNYFLRIKNASKKKTAAILYGMDSNSYAKGFGQNHYGFFHFNQVNWFQETSRKLTKENNHLPYPGLAFFHIPLSEYGWLEEDTNRIRIGRRNEKECYGALNTGMYAAMQLSGGVMGTFVGHDHINDYIGQLYTVCLAYGRFSGGPTTYGNLTNGARVIELTEDKRGFLSWIYTTAGEKLDEVYF